MSKDKYLIWWSTLSIRDRKLLLNTNSIKDTINLKEELIKVLYNESFDTKSTEDANTWFNKLSSHYQTKLFNTIDVQENQTTQDVIKILYNKALEMRVWYNVIKLL